MIVNSIIHKIYLNIVSAIYKYWYKYICIHIYIYIYMYMQFMIFAITLYKFLHYDLHIYIYIYILINILWFCIHAVICKLVNHSISSGCCQCHTSMIVGSHTVCYTCWHTSMPLCNLSIMLMFNFEMAMRFLNCKRIAEVEQDRKGKQILTFDLLFLWKAASALDVILWDHVHCQS